VIVPQIWQDEIEKGTPFGIRAARAVAASQSQPRKHPRIAPPPDVSDVGTRLWAAIQADAKYTLTCGFCKTYLANLNKILNHDPEKILADLKWELRVPDKCRHPDAGIEKMNRESWLRGVIESVMPEAWRDARQIDRHARRGFDLGGNGK
jgi:hypothetical protein